ncbi:HNH endonuclease [Adhaeretor mobilis]|uniref:HNH endonuclease 5 domain-containing protein n=1 Tax=Adhaeretor mobilis TaxID=1930276 RepID=A0A517MUX3_9BACT|nr:HNH endonuclease [Adhaeretor mobilis]QDS98684.1 hypothetical protein HG15A2_19650 [Adhaeretor mobilis]
MSPSQKESLFDHYRKSLAAADLKTTHQDSLICPLCWQETRFDDLSLEHIMPGSVGGKRCILTCTQCNNEHGSSFDSHLAQFQKLRDGFKGHGTIPAKLKVLGKEVVANVEWGDGYKNINIVGKASNPAEVSAMQDDAKAGNVGELNLTLLYGYNKNNFQTGLLRCAYLAVFKCFGYEYANHEVVQVIRRRICDSTLEHPRLESLIGELRDGSLPYRDSYVIVPGNVNGVEFFLVILLLRKETVTNQFVYMPVPVARCDEFCDMMERSSKDNDGKKLTIPHELVFT